MLGDPALMYWFLRYFLIFAKIFLLLLLFDVIQIFKLNFFVTYLFLVTFKL